MFFRWFSYDSPVGSYPAWKLCLGSPPRENSSSCCCENPMGWPLMAACSPWSAKGNWFSKTSLGQLGVLTHDWWRTSKISRMKTDGFVRGSKSETWEVQTCSGFDHPSIVGINYRKWDPTNQHGYMPVWMAMGQTLWARLGRCSQHILMSTNYFDVRHGTGFWPILSGADCDLWRFVGWNFFCPRGGNAEYPRMICGHR